MKMEPNFPDLMRHSWLCFNIARRLVTGSIQDHLKWSVLTISGLALAAYLAWDSWHAWAVDDIKKTTVLLFTVPGVLLAWSFVQAPSVIWRQQEDSIRDLKASLVPPANINATIIKLRSTRLQGYAPYVRDAAWALRSISEPGPRGLNAEGLYSLSVDQESWRQALDAGGTGIAMCVKETHARQEEFYELLKILESTGLASRYDDKQSASNFVPTPLGLEIAAWIRRTQA